MEPYETARAALGNKRSKTYNVTFNNEKKSLTIKLADDDSIDLIFKGEGFPDSSIKVTDQEIISSYPGPVRAALLAIFNMFLYGQLN